MGGDFQMESETTFHLFLAFLIAAIVLFTGFMAISNSKKSAADSQASVRKSKRRFRLVLVGILLSAFTVSVFYLIYYGYIIIKLMNELGGKD